MARKKDSFSDNNRDKIRESQDPKKPASWVQSDTFRGIIIVVLTLFSIISFLSFIHLAGPFGELWGNVLVLFFGWTRFLIPLLLLLFAYLFLLPQKFQLKFFNYTGFAMVMLFMCGFFHLFIPSHEWKHSLENGNGGGYFGLFLSWPFIKIFGIWASGLIFFSLIIIGLLLAFNTSLEILAGKQGWVGWIMRRLFVIKEGVYEWLSRRSAEDPDGKKANSGENREVVHSFEKTKIFPQDNDVEMVSGIAKNIIASDVRKRQQHPRIQLPLDLLDNASSKPRSGDIEYNKHKIKTTLQSFGIEVDMGDVNVGPTVTQYTLKPADGVKLSQITTLQNDLSLSLAVHPIRIEAPIPGKSLVGIEVPNKATAIVCLREILESNTFKKRNSNLMLALGKDVAGSANMVDLENMPHLLVAGATGSGKSVCLNTIILSLLYQNQMDQLKIILIDPKRVEFTTYNGIPHLLTPVITDVDKTINALKWLVGEMDRRYQLLSQCNKRNIDTYNNSLKDEKNNLPYIIVVIDELADLMAVAAQDVEGAIIRLAQMARAVGIHLVLSTQRPSVNVITGLIKANITSRIAFTVASQTDSRTILDSSGAEKLLGKGDMLYISAELSKPKRIQGAYISDSEIQRVVHYLKEEGGEPEYHQEVLEKPKKQYYGLGDSTPGDTDDTLLDEAQEVVVRAEKASASLLQRRLRVGYARAARLLDMLEERGVIGPADGARPREVLITERDSFSERNMRDEEPDSL